MKIIIGIDDTDNLETRGTGHQARTLGLGLTEAGLFSLRSVTRHQLLVDRRIPFTSHNSSASLEGEALADLDQIIDYCKDFLVRVSAFDSDAGLCVAPLDQVSDEVMLFGDRAKVEILTKEEALQIAKRNNIYLDAFLNTRVGMIGSLAAVGLRAAGNDGRLLWTKNLRETTGEFRISEFMQLTGVQCAVDVNGGSISDESFISINEWCRPVMRNGLITLIAERKNNNDKYEYQSASKEYIKSISE